MSSLTQRLAAAESAGSVADLAALVRELMAPKPKAFRKKALHPMRWTVVEFADGITVLRSNYAAEGDYTSAIAGAQRLRAAALADGDYSRASEFVGMVPAVASARHVEGADIDAARDIAFAQRNDGPTAWGRCLTDAATSWTHRRAVQEAIWRRESTDQRRAEAAQRVADIAAEVDPARVRKIARSRFKIVGGTEAVAVAA